MFLKSYYFFFILLFLHLFSFLVLVSALLSVSVLVKVLICFHLLGDTSDSDRQSWSDTETTDRGVGEGVQVL